VLHPIWFWKHQWALEGWQDQLIFLPLFLVSLRVAVKRGHSFVEVLGQRADAVFVGVLQKWAKPRPREAGRG
jgi:hypothetical protein